MTERKLFAGGEFIITDTSPEDVFTPEQFSNEHKMVKKTANDFVMKELVENAELIEEKNEDQVRKWFRTLGEMGMNAVDVPEEYGGEGMDKISACLVTESMGAGHSFAASHTCQTGIGSLPILLFGTEYQKKKYLPKLASGEHIGAYCLTESNAGSDALNASTTAVLSDDGSHYILNGEKIFITNGAWADVLTVFAKVDGHFTGFIVEKTFDGFSTGPEEKKLGIKGSSTVSVILKDCKVPVENMLFEIGKGHKIAFNVLNIGRYKLGPVCCGGMKAAITGAARYASERVQFGKKICEFGMIRDKLAQMCVNAYVTESASYRLAAAIQDKLASLPEEARHQGAEISRAVEEYAVECSLVKVGASELLDHAVDELVQIHGGNGYIAEYPAERAYRDSRINRIFEGTNEINRMLAAGTLLKRAVAGKVDLFGAVENPGIFSGNGGPAANATRAAKRIFLLTVKEAGTRLMATLADEQEVLALLADMMIPIYFMESGMLRAAKAKGSKLADLQDAAARVYASQALPRVVTCARQILAYVEKDEALAKLLAAVDDLAAGAGQENVVGLKRLLADQVTRGKRYPF